MKKSKRAPVISKEAERRLAEWFALDPMARGMAIDSLEGTDDDLMPDPVYCKLVDLLAALEPQS